MRRPSRSPETPPSSAIHLREVLGYSRRALDLVWDTSRRWTLIWSLLAITIGVLPALMAWIGKEIVDTVVLATQNSDFDRNLLWFWLSVELGLVVIRSACQRGVSVVQSLLRTLLGHRVNVLILEKAQRLNLTQFEDAEFYDKMTMARREASSRPLSLVQRTFSLIQQGISLSSYAILLGAFSPWAVVLVLVGGIPVFWVETKFSGDAFRLFRWRSPETRRQSYFETVLAREDYVKEVKLYNLGSRFLERYREIFHEVFAQDRALTFARGFWGWFWGLLSTAAFYAAYAWIALATVEQKISLGEMTMYLLLFKQGQSAVSNALSAISGMYEDNLYLSNLYDFLEQPTAEDEGGLHQGPHPGDGIRFLNVDFHYPGNHEPALTGISLHLRPGRSLALVGENGSGKTTVIKLLTRLYTPSRGVITLDGLDLKEWDPKALRERIAVVFQDFSRYQFTVGHNIGAGNIQNFDDEQEWDAAAQKGLFSAIAQGLPQGYHTQLGKWFKDGRELSGGQWQKVALSRAFMRKDADIWVLDEPTSALDAAAESKVFGHVQKLTRERMSMLISHRFSTVRMADHIVVLERGRIIEEGDHPSLLQKGGRYAQNFELQAKGYR